MLKDKFLKPIISSILDIITTTIVIDNHMAIFKYKFWKKYDK